jgi:hypothetical protein
VPSRAKSSLLQIKVLVASARASIAKTVIAGRCLVRFLSQLAVRTICYNRIYSDQKWPERIVYDTNVTMVRSAPAAIPEATSSAPPTVAVASSKLREALAELSSQPVNPKKPQHKFAKKHAAKPVRLAMRRAPFGWFGPTIW